jgi:hypothetical protein
MYKAPWALVALAAVALGTAVFGGVINNSDVRAESESVGRREIATLQAEVHALSAARSGSH